MGRIAVALICGLLFGAGLVVSDMVNPARVLAFLDVTGAWDPSLALVMAGALVPSAGAYAVRRRLSRPILDQRFFVPAPSRVDGRLAAGAILFGAGWGLVGLCPGPALAGLVTGRWPVVVFVAAMVAGMALYRSLPTRLGPNRPPLQPAGK